ncbi:hypothetical protein [Dactylosporangium sp. CA-233914]|uniref:hypothetical protein n=1 Tax=Dactylosporangium sp. CA-233914 TaxID=3239934 RepID=UPI003D9099D5
MGVDYNTGGSFSVDQGKLYEIGRDVAQLGRAIGVEYEAIGKRWQELKIGWAGKSQQEAESFVEVLRAVTADYFGEPEESATEAHHSSGGKPGSESGKEGDEPQQGVLNRFATAILGGAIVYDTTERQLYSMFKTMTEEVFTMTAQLVSGGGGADPGEAQNYNRNFTEGPVTEITPTVAP